MLRSNSKSLGNHAEEKKAAVGMICRKGPEQVEQVTRRVSSLSIVRLMRILAR